MRTPIWPIFLIGVSIIYDAEGYPSRHAPADNTVYGSEHCVHMTPENEARISTIVDKLTEYLYNLTIEHEVFDIRLLKIVIEGHSDDEVEEKDTQVQLEVNDCYYANIGQEYDEEIVEEASDETVSSEVVEATTDNESYVVANSTENQTSEPDVIEADQNVADNSTQNVSGTNVTQNCKNDTSRPDDETAPETAGDGIQLSSVANYEVPGPVMVRLDLDKNGNKLVKGTQAKRGEHVPLFLYIQRALGNIQYLFAN